MSYEACKWRGKFVGKLFEEAAWYAVRSGGFVRVDVVEYSSDPTCADCKVVGVGWRIAGLLSGVVVHRWWVSWRRG